MASLQMCCVHASFTKVLDRLTKFSEASLKMYEDIRQKKWSGSNCILQNYQSWIMLILNYRLWAAVRFGDFKRIWKTP